jgi:hypothetical protein
MSLIRREVTGGMADANRVNAQKSTGPTSARGKSASACNAKKWGRAELLRPLMPALGEDPKEFEEVLDGLRRVFAPSDEIEELLVTDMAEVHWRIRRMILAETAARAKNQRQHQALNEAATARLEAGELHVLELFVARGGLGLVGLNDSPVTFRQIIELFLANRRRGGPEGIPGRRAGLPAMPLRAESQLSRLEADHRLRGLPEALAGRDPAGGADG